MQRFIEQYPDLLAVVSCRELDYTLDLGFDKINITPLDPLRIREFAGRYLGDDRGNDLFWKLAGQKARKRYHSFMKWAEEVEFADAEAHFWLNQALSRVSKSDVWKEWDVWLYEREKPSGLMILARNPYMLLMLTSVYAEEGKLPDNRGQLFGTFVETLLERELVPQVE